VFDYNFLLQSEKEKNGTSGAYLNSTNQLRFLYVRLIYSRPLPKNANDKVDNLDEKHDGESQPETQDAADV